MRSRSRRENIIFTKCVRVEDASTLLRMKGSVFHIIIIIEQCLLGVNGFELLRIGREMDLPVIVTFEDGQPNIVRWSLENGTCEYRLKLIPMSVLNTVSTICIFFKKENKWAQVQQPTNNVSRVRNQRMSWTPDSHEKFEESVQKLGGANKAKPKEILRFLQRNYEGFEDVKGGQVSSHLQKYRDNLKKEAQSPMTSVDQVLKSTVANEPGILSQQQQAPAAKNTQGFQSGTLPFGTNVPTIGGSTSCGNQSNAVMTRMDEAFSSKQMLNEYSGGQPSDWERFFNFPDDSFQGGISGGPGFHNNAPLPGPFHTDHGEHGCSQDGIAENFNGNVIARETF